MKILRCIAAAFAMFSRLPMPQIRWDAQVSAYLLCGLPLVGLLIGGAELLWLYLAELLGFGLLLRAVGMTLLPLLISGGIHMDGFCDTQDALACHGSPEQRRQILKDPNSGAFAVIGVGMYLLAYLGFCSELPLEGVSPLLFGLSFVLSRSFSGLVSLAYPKGAGEGLLHTFRSGKGQPGPLLLLVTGCLLAAGAGLLLSPLLAGTMLLALGGCLLALLHLAKKKFTGISGDLSGWFLQSAELAMLMALVLVPKLASAILGGVVS